MTDCNETNRTEPSEAEELAVLIADLPATDRARLRTVIRALRSNRHETTDGQCATPSADPLVLID